MPYIFAFFLALLTAAAVSASETDIGNHLDLELNSVQPVDGGCQLTFVALNGHPTPIESVVFETVLFDANGNVERFSLFDFGHLPAAKPRVRQFVLPSLRCTDLGRVLINGTHSCSGEGLGAGACLDGLTVTTKTDVEFLG